MERFPNAGFVRLRNRARGVYLFANEDGRSVSLSDDFFGTTYNSVWGVQTVDTDHGPYVLLRSAAYGRYLTATVVRARRGYRGFIVAQGTRDQQPIMWPVMWRVTIRRGHFVLQSASADRRRYLRANGRYVWWHRGVTVEALNGMNTAISTMMQWVVEVIPLRADRPDHLHEQPLIPTRPGILSPFPDVRGREIRYAVADDDGNINEEHWTTISFDGRNLTVLAVDLARRMGNGVDFLNITVCARAGRHGRISPLLTYLPCSTEPMDVVVVMANTPGHNRLQFPDIE